MTELEKITALPGMATWGWIESTAELNINIRFCFLCLAFLFITAAWEVNFNNNLCNTGCCMTVYLYIILHIFIKYLYKILINTESIITFLTIQILTLIYLKLDSRLYIKLLIIRVITDYYKMFFLLTLWSFDIW